MKGIKTVPHRSAPMAPTAPPSLPAEQTPGEQIAGAVWEFNRGLIEQDKLAARIDAALKAYR